MNLEEKVGQMTKIERANATADVMKTYFIRSVLSSGGSAPKANATAKEWTDMVNCLQQAALSAHLGLEVRATGIPYAFAPCLALGPYNCATADNPHRRTTRNTPRTKVAGCSKHYVGDGGTVNGINEQNTIVDDSALYGIHMPAYVKSMAKGVATVMASYSSVNGVEMHANKQLLTDHLKGKLGFQVMVPYEYKEFINGLIDLVKKNVIPMSRIDEAVTRILRVKFSLDLFEYPLGDYSLVNVVGSQTHRELARKAVRKSLVLLKNGKPGNPPLQNIAGKILVTGTHANNSGYQYGGWTIEWQGFSGYNWKAGTTILDAVKKTVVKNTKVVYKMNPSEDYPEKAKLDFAIVVVGEVPYAETRGDSTNLTIPDPDPHIIENACRNIKCVVVLISGRPVVIEPYLDKMDAPVAAWLPGSEGQGVADVLFGDFGFTCKVARTWFKRVDQLPVNVEDPKYDPLLPFGFGLETQPTSQRTDTPKVEL
ncbi:lysosomal beta glucosidase-like isoform X1 [Hibiscus syriacus]|uniref:Lysosomal beta glucosidase-like isoform X1 n=1 Tax=Hibiscus syriacus TaxID=106335 RepID=A0A6A2X2H0_HIBSY|nr:lysosomal beta glucosidase-like isoform X1 [Hibiscus syriacus]